ncbi:41566_t:CDS:2, partial [Gigaspora margarita]
KSGKKLHEINFKFNGRDIIAWSIEHENQAKMKGLYPKVLEKLLIRRNSLKKLLAPLKDKKEELEKEISLVEAKVKRWGLKGFDNEADEDNVDEDEADED